MKIYKSEMTNNQLTYSLICDIEAESYPQALSHPLVSNALPMAKSYKFTALLVGNEKAINIIPTSLCKDVDSLFITDNDHIPKGEVVAIAGAVAAAITAAVGATAAIIIGYVVAAVVVIGVSMLLNMVLSPSSKTRNSDSIDAAIVQKNLLFNGIQNITYQGGSVPLLFGTTLCGGVVISKRLSTSTILTPLSPLTAPSTWSYIP